MKKTYETGLKGELAAEEWLRNNRKMTCLERRYRSKAGEIDLIMLEGDTIVFVEVKTRRSGQPGSGIMSIDQRKQSRISRASLIYLMKKRWLNRNIRYDVVELNPEGILYIPNAFQPGGMFYK